MTDCSLMGPHQPALQERDNPVDSWKQVGGRLGSAAQNNDSMPIAFGLQSIVSFPSICCDQAARLDRVLHKWHKAICRSVQHTTQSDSSDTFAIFLCSDHNHSLLFCLAASDTFFPAAQVRFINFNGSGQPVSAGTNHSPAKFVQPSPCGFVAAKPKNSLQSKRAGPVFLARHPPHGSKPQCQRLSRIFKHRPCCQRCSVVAFRALPQILSYGPCLGMSATRTGKAIRPSQAEQVFATGFLCGEPGLEFWQRSGVVSHAP